MKYLSYILFVFALISFTFCQSKKDKIVKFLKSNEVDSLMQGIYMVGETKDTTFVDKILQDPIDTRISHHLRFKGMSLYRQKMLTMRKLTGTPPPHEITDQPDSIIVQFYIEKAKERGWTY